ncbi:hypothetical protein D3C80_1817080 [compost metagenome]
MLDKEILEGAHQAGHKQNDAEQQESEFELEGIKRFTAQGKHKRGDHLPEAREWGQPEIHIYVLYIEFVKKDISSIKNQPVF